MLGLYPSTGVLDLSIMVTLLRSSEGCALPRRGVVFYFRFSRARELGALGMEGSTDAARPYLKCPPESSRGTRTATWSVRRQ